MIRNLLALGGIGAGAAAMLDRWLAGKAGGDDPDPIISEITVDASPERVWAVLADIAGQPRWMHEMKSVRMLTPPPLGVGSRGEAQVRVVGIEVTDPVTITEWDPPRRFSVRHEGTFTGGGTFSLEPGAGGTTTTVRWEENPIPPILPHLGSRVQRPILAAIFAADLERLRRLVEAEG
ncbi:MAG TPA: SRPBCC family protein [Vitreimonas sp.]|nr:SRPBCC family protein [Vitreimonas sp.]